jgi:hypothetical protein
MKKFAWLFLLVGLAACGRGPTAIQNEYSKHSTLRT